MRKLSIGAEENGRWYANAEPSLINKEGVESRGGMPKKIWLQQYKVKSDDSCRNAVLQWLTVTVGFMAIACSRPQTANPNLKRLEETGSENYRGK